MKASKYNFFFPYEADDSKLIAYNAFSNALALMEKDKHDMFQQFVDGSITIDDREFVEQLKKGCFLVDDDVNELDRLRLRMFRSRFNTNSLALTIVPTADCQFRCPYCYEKDVIKPLYMTAEIEEAIVKLAQKHMGTIASLSVTWYGGEPLMNMETIKRLSGKLIKLCEENDVTYNADMVTNGYLLTKENALLLSELKVVTMQITLDGSEEIHNQRRPLADGSGTFSRIIDNLVENKDVIPPVSLRINVDKNNMDSGKEVVRILEEKDLLSNVKPYIASVLPDNDAYDKSSCFDVCGFSAEELMFFKEFYNDELYMNRYPRTIRNYCGADSITSYVINADGGLYKCWRDLGNSLKCTGSLVGDDNIGEHLFLDYMLFDPMSDSECSQCDVLPLCMGGCPCKRVTNTEKCSVHKFVLDGFLSVIAEKLKLKKQLSV